MDIHVGTYTHNMHNGTKVGEKALWSESPYQAVWIYRTVVINDSGTRLKEQLPSGLLPVSMLEGKMILERLL